jgi:signal transduction histidine kinase
LSVQSGESGSGRYQAPARPARRHFLHERVLLGLAFSLAALAGSFVMWDPLAIDERAHIQRITRHAAEAARAGIAGELRSLLGAQTLLARSWAESGPLTHAEWEYEASLFFDNHPGCLVVEWIDFRSGVRWRRSRDGLDRSDVEAITSNAWPAEADSMRAELEPVLGPVLRLPGGRTALLTRAPAGRGQIADGQLRAVFDLEVTLRTSLSVHQELGYSILLQEGQQVLFQSPERESRDETKWAEVSAVRLAGLQWRIRVSPGQGLLDDMRSPLPEVALVLGGLLGVLGAFAASRARNAQRDSVALKQARDEVARRVTDRTAELERVNRKLRAEVQERTSAEQSLRNLSTRLLKLQDDERRRIARELHDSTSQILAAVSIGLERARRSLERGAAEEAEGVLLENADLVAQVTREIRTLSFLLHPPVLDDLGLEYALPWYVKGFSGRSGIPVSVDVPRELGRLPAQVELTLYRTIQEALANVRHHSGSRNASVLLTRERDTIALEIADNGRGFDAGADTASGAGALGVGIAGMRERVRQLGGVMEIQSGEGGTTIRVALPLKSHESAGTAA